MFNVPILKNKKIIVIPCYLLVYNNILYIGTYKIYLIQSKYFDKINLICSKYFSDIKIKFVSYNIKYKINLKFQRFKLM